MPRNSKSAFSLPVGNCALLGTPELPVRRCAMTVWLAPGKLKTAGPQGVHGLINELADAVVVEPGAGEAPSCAAVVINMEGPVLRRSRIRHSHRVVVRTVLGGRGVPLNTWGKLSQGFC